MALLAVLLLLLLAPEETYELKYRFEKETTRRDVSEKSIKLSLFAEGKIVKFDLETHHEIERTVLEVDREGRPTIERVQVKKFTQVVNQSPEGKEGTKTFASHGKTFVWRKEKEAWNLYDAQGEVTKRYPNLVVLLRNWRDARLPPGPVKLGDTWEVAAKTFLETVGQQVPPQVEGKAVFRLEEVKEDVARIAIEFKSSWRNAGHLLAGLQQGTWLFDLKHGRDVEVRMEGNVEVDNGKGGWGKFRLRRVVTVR
ncbi:MAG: hypothetical protein ACYTEZ_04450 [Planctomycetota bacterium]|jgi:hypothetical protein